jgi:hypothetical protein
MTGTDASVLVGDELDFKGESKSICRLQFRR